MEKKKKPFDLKKAIKKQEEADRWGISVEEVDGEFGPDDPTEEEPKDDDTEEVEDPNTFNPSDWD